MIYGFPGNKLTVVAVTGTKGKSTTSELLTHLLEQSGKKVFLSSTIHFKIAGEEKPNLLKMTMPGRLMLQRLLREAIKKGCTHAVIEMSSEGTKLWRHVGIQLNGLVVTNLSPEHIESHGSFENYRAAKLRLMAALNKSKKPNKFLILNESEAELIHFEQAAKKEVIIKKFNADKANYSTLLPGRFNLENALAAASAAEMLGLSLEQIQTALNNFSGAKGRVEKLEAGPLDEARGRQNFDVIVDYAHTADSLEKFYQLFEGKKKICVFGATGGGRDKWKRPVMGGVANKYCDEIILTDDDSYDEDINQICQEIAAGIKDKKFQIITDRREAIKTALRLAGAGDVVLLTGKGTDPFLMGKNGKKTPWSDADIAREELQKLLA